MKPESIESLLRKTKPRCCVPAGLHDAVMSRVRAVAVNRHSGTEEPHMRQLRVIWVTLVAIACAVVFLGVMEHQDEKVLSRHAANGLGIEALLSGSGIDVFVDPLAREVERARIDIRNAVEFLFASVP